MVRFNLFRPLPSFLILAALATAIYSNTFFASFHFDDPRNITENTWIKNLSNLRDLSGSRYVGFLTFALNYHFGRLNVFGYHLVNLLIHILNGFLVYTLVRLLFRAGNTPPLTPEALRLPAGQAGLTPAPWVALATALLFIAHPIQTQAVTYIVQRIASLAALFYLLTVVCYLQWRLTPPETKRRHLWYVGALAATILAMKTKENTFTLPFMLLLVEAVFFTPFTRKTWIRLLPFLLTLPIIPLSRPGALGEGEAGFARDTMDISRWDYLLTQFRVIITYLRLLIFPVNQNLDYDYQVYHSLFTPPVFLSFLFLAALFGLSIYLLFASRRMQNYNGAPPLRPGSNLPAQRRLPYAALRLTAFGILWFFLTLSIESSIIPIRDVIYEHRLYLPSVGIFLTAAVAALGLSDRWMNQRIIAVGLVIFVLAGVAYQRNKVWQDELTLWSDVVIKSPKKARAHNGLGVAYAGQKRWEEAISEYKTALTLNPDYERPYNNLGLAYSTLESYGDAIQEYNAALALKPDFAEAHNNLGMVYLEQGALDKAAREFQDALKLGPEHAESHNNLGLVYTKMRLYEKAIHEFESASLLNPDYAEPYYNLGNIYRDTGQFDKAMQNYRLAVNRNPDYALAHNNLGLGYYIQGKLPEALAQLKETVRLKPDYVEAHNNLGVMYKSIGQPREAIQEFQTAIQLKPDHADAYYNLGTTYRQIGQNAEAIRAFEEAIKINPHYERARKALESISP